MIAPISGFRFGWEWKNPRGNQSETPPLNWEIVRVRAKLVVHFIDRIFSSDGISCRAKFLPVVRVGILVFCCGENEILHEKILGELQVLK